MTRYTEQQLDALGELANIGSGTAGTALSTLIGRPVDISVPHVRAMPVEEAVAAAGDADREVRAILVPITRDLQGSALIVFPPEDAASLCRMLGADPDGEDGASALAEIGNILVQLLPRRARRDARHGDRALPARDGLGHARRDRRHRPARPGRGDDALLMDSELLVAGESIGLEFMLLPLGQGIGDLLERLGL